MPINKKSIYLKELEAVRAEIYQTVSTTVTLLIQQQLIN